LESRSELVLACYDSSLGMQSEPCFACLLFLLMALLLPSSLLPVLRTAPVFVLPWREKLFLSHTTHSGLARSLQGSTCISVSVSLTSLVWDQCS